MGRETELAGSIDDPLAGSRRGPGARLPTSVGQVSAPVATSCRGDRGPGLVLSRRGRDPPHREDWALRDRRPLSIAEPRSAEDPPARRPYGMGRALAGGAATEEPANLTLAGELGAGDAVRELRRDWVVEAASSPACVSSLSEYRLKSGDLAAPFLPLPFLGGLAALGWLLPFCVHTTGDGSEARHRRPEHSSTAGFRGVIGVIRRGSTHVHDPTGAIRLSRVGTASGKAEVQGSRALTAGPRDQFAAGPRWGGPVCRIRE